MKTGQTGFLCFASPRLHVPILRGKMFFLVWFLCELELDACVQEGSWGPGGQFLTLPIQPGQSQGLSPRDTTGLDTEGWSLRGQAGRGAVALRAGSPA